MDFTWQEIHEQPAVLERLLREEWGEVQTIAKAIRASGIRWVLLAARGTSDHAAIYAQYLLGWRQRLPAALATPSLYTLYQAPPRLSDVLVVGISQSGRSPDVVSVIDSARAQGQLTLALTNEPNSALAKAARFVIPLQAGPERSVAATKTYSAELMAVAMLSAALSADPGQLNDLKAIPAKVAETLERNAGIDARVAELAGITQTVSVGRGLTLTTALEAGLKLKEMNYISANAYSSADFLHGPIVIVEQGFPVVLVVTGGVTYADMRAVQAECNRRGARTIVISDQPEALAEAAIPLPLAGGIPEWLMPLPAIVPAQLLGRGVSVARGLNPDQPRGLTKVTETR